MPAQDMRYLRAAVNDDTGANGGYPINVLLSPSAAFPKTFSADNPRIFLIACKIFQHYTSDGQAPEYAAYYIFDIPPLSKGNHYFNLVPCGNRDTWADLDLNTLPRYGVGHLTAAANVGDTSLTVQVRNVALATGAERIYRADGAGAEDYLMIDKRAAAGTLDGAQHEDIIGTNAVAVGDVVSITLATPLVNAYPIGAKVRSTPAKSDMVTSIDNVDKSNIGTTTIDEAQIITTRAGTWEDTITLEILNSSGNYSLTSQQYGPHGSTFNKTSSASPTWPGFSSPQFTLPAGCIGGTNAAGHKVIFETHAAMVSSFLVYHHPANANVQTSTLVKAVKWEE